MKKFALLKIVSGLALVFTFVAQVPKGYIMYEFDD